MVSPDSAQSAEVGGEAQAPQQPAQEGVTAGDLARRDEEIASVKQQLAEFISNASRRETELIKQRDAAKKAIELGEDSQEYQAWLTESIREDERQQSSAKLAALELENTKWRLLKEYPDVPDTALEGATSSQEMENKALRWKLQGNTGAPGSTGHPETPQIMTPGGSGAGVGKSYKEIADAYSRDPYDAVNRKAYNEARKARGL